MERRHDATIGVEGLVPRAGLGQGWPRAGLANSKLVGAAAAASASAVATAWGGRRPARKGVPREMPLNRGVPCGLVRPAPADCRAEMRPALAAPAACGRGVTRCSAMARPCTPGSRTSARPPPRHCGGAAVAGPVCLGRGPEPAWAFEW